MTDEEWQSVLTYVHKRLENESSFEIKAKTLAAELGIKLPFYKEVRRRLALKREFGMRSYVHGEEDGHEPIDTLTFSP